MTPEDRAGLGLAAICALAIMGVVVAAVVRDVLVAQARCGGLP